MKRFLAIMCLTAIVLFVANGPQARANGGPGGMEPDNWYNACGSYPQIPYDYPGTFYTTLPTGPTATVDGMVWLKTGSGSPALFNSPNLMVSTYYENTSGAGNCSPPKRIRAGTPAIFSPRGTATRALAGRLMTSCMSAPRRFRSPNIEGADRTFNQGLLYQQFWTDPLLQSSGTSAYANYAAANTASAGGASGVYVAQTVPFLVDLNPGGMGGLWLDANNTGMYMPAVVPAKGVVTSPEPSTFVLMLGGLLGLVAYAWRKHK